VELAKRFFLDESNNCFGQNLGNFCEILGILSSTLGNF